MFNQVKSRTHFDFKVKRNEIQLSLISRVDVGDVYRKKQTFWLWFAWWNIRDLWTREEVSNYRWLLRERAPSYWDTTIPNGGSNQCHTSLYRGRIGYSFCWVRSARCSLPYCFDHHWSPTLSDSVASPIDCRNSENIQMDAVIRFAVRKSSPKSVHFNGWWSVRYKLMVKRV